MVFPSVVAWTLLGLAVVQGQLVSSPSGNGGSPAAPSQTEQAPPPRTEPSSLPASFPSSPSEISTPTGGVVPAGNSSGLSDWILYKRPCSCHHPVGDDGPILTELYLRTGISNPFGPGAYGDNLDTGWIIQGGARTLFFEPSCDRAWAIDLSILHMHNDMKNDVRVPLNIITLDPLLANPVPRRFFFGRNGIPPVQLRSLDRTFVNLGGGREWYLLGNRSCCQTSWRVGVDAGGGWGSARGTYFDVRDFNNLVDGQPITFGIPQRTDVIGRLYFGAHTDLEVPCGCCIWQFGVRAEYSYTWSDILQILNRADVQDINIMFNVGVRF